MISFGRFWPGDCHRPNRLNVPLVLSGFVALDKQGFLHKPPSLTARHVNHHGDAVHHAPHTLSLLTDPNRQVTPLAQALVLFRPVDHRYCTLSNLCRRAALNLCGIWTTPSVEKTNDKTFFGMIHATRSVPIEASHEGGRSPSMAAKSGSASPLRRPWCNRKAASDIRRRWPAHGKAPCVCMHPNCLMCTRGSAPIRPDPPRDPKSRRCCGRLSVGVVRLASVGKIGQNFSCHQPEEPHADVERERREVRLRPTHRPRPRVARHGGTPGNGGTGVARNGTGGR